MKIVADENILEKIDKDFNNLRFISQTRYPEILFTKDSTKVYVYLEKARPLLLAKQKHSIYKYKKSQEQEFLAFFVDLNKN